MALLIDGHNLIPKIPGLSLSEPDDEIELLGLLQEYCRLRRQNAECFFDRALEGRPRTRTIGTIVVKFARAGQTADNEIRERLAALGKRARNYTVVSSDQSIQLAARSARAEVKSSERFAQEMMDAISGVASQGKRSQGEGEDISVSPEEVEMWLRAFRARKKD